MSDTTKKAVFSNLGLVGGNAKSLKPSAISSNDISSNPMKAKQLGAPQNNRFINQTALLNNKANGTLNKSATSFDVSPYAHSPYVNNLGFDRDVYSSTPITGGDVSTKRAEFFDELSSKVMNTDAPTAPTAPAPAPSPAPSPTPEPAPELKAPAPVAPAPTVGNTGSIYDTQKGYDQRVGAHAPDPLLAPAKTFAQEVMAPNANIKELVNRDYVTPQFSKPNYSAPDPEKVKEFANWHKSTFPNKNNTEVDYSKVINDAASMYDPDHPEYTLSRQNFVKQRRPSTLPKNFAYLSESQQNRILAAQEKSVKAMEASDRALTRSNFIRPEVLDYLDGAGLIRKGTLPKSDYASGFAQSRGIYPANPNPNDDLPPVDLTPDSEAFKKGRDLDKFRRLVSISKELDEMPQDARVKVMEQIPPALAIKLQQASEGKLSPSMSQAFDGLAKKTHGELGDMDGPDGSSQSIFSFLANPKSTISIEDRIKTLPPDKQALINNLPDNQLNLIKYYADIEGNQSTIAKSKVLANNSLKNVEGIRPADETFKPGYWFDGPAGNMESKLNVGLMRKPEEIFDYLRAFNPLSKNTANDDVAAQKITDQGNIAVGASEEASRLMSLLSEYQNPSPNSSYAEITPDKRQVLIQDIMRKLRSVNEDADTSRGIISQLDAKTTNPMRDAMIRRDWGSMALNTGTTGLNVAFPTFLAAQTAGNGFVDSLEGSYGVNHNNKRTIGDTVGLIGGLAPGILKKLPSWGERLSSLVTPSLLAADPSIKFVGSLNKPKDYIQQINNAKTYDELTNSRSEMAASLLNKSKAKPVAPTSAPAGQLSAASGGSDVKTPEAASGMTSLQKGLLAAGIGIPAILAITAALGSKKKVKPVDEDDDEEDDEEDEIAYKRKLRARNAHR